MSDLGLEGWLCGEELGVECGQTGRQLRPPDRDEGGWKEGGGSRTGKRS